MSKFLIFLILILANVGTANSVQMTEIVFDGSEFVELYSKESINLSGAKVYDETYSKTRYNKIELLYENKSSNTYLIFGSSFYNKYNISNLDCNLYMTDKSQVSNGGLKSKGESFEIYMLNNKSIIYNHSKDISYEENESLNVINNSKQIASPCLYIFNNTNQEVEDSVNNSIQINDSFESNITNISNNHSTFNNSLNISKNNTTIIDDEYYDFCIERNFNLTLDKSLTMDNIEIIFDLDNSINNYSIEYWVEDFEENIVKNKLNTTNTNPKSFTPNSDFPNIYNVISELSFGSCELEQNQTFFYYTKPKKQSKVDSKDTSTKNKCDESSYIKINNKDELYYLNTDYLDFTVQKGCITRKSKFEIRHNTKPIFEFNLDKEQKISKRIKLNITPKTNIISFEGLDLDNKFYFGDFKKEESLEDKTDKELIEIRDIKIKQETVFFSILANFNYSGSCILMKDRSFYSNSTNISNQDLLYSLELQKNKLKNKTKELRINCRYKEEDNKSYEYFREFFNYSKPEKKIKNISSELHQKSLTSSYLEKNEINQKIVKNSINYSNSANSKNINIKNWSSLPALLAAGLLTGFLVIRRKEL